MNVGQAAHLSGQTAQMNQVPGTGVGVGVGGADGLPQHQPMQEMSALSGDQQFVMLRTAMREKIFEYIGRKQSSAEWRKRLPELAKQLEEILYRKFPNKNEYYNMMKGPVEPQLQFAIKTLSAQNQHNQQIPQMTRQIASSSGYGTMIPTPGMVPQNANMGGGADGLPQHQPMQEMAALSGTDQQFVMLRTAMREKIFEYIGSKQSSAEWRKRLPELAKRLEEILYRKFPNKNEYYNMMKGPVEPQLQFAIKTLSAQNQQKQRNPQVERQTSSSNMNPLHVSEGQIHEKLRCHFCKKTGHFKKDCLKRKKWFKKKGIPYDPTHKRT